MYAVIKTGGKQYRVKADEVLKIESLVAEIGKDVKFDEVLLIGEGDAVVSGSPFIPQAVVKATVLSHGRHKKIRIIKFRRRKHYMKRMGHRQNYTEVKIVSISQPNSEH